MNAATPEELTPWSEEPAGEGGLQRVRAGVAGLHCSLCTGTIESALRRRDGVERVSVSLTHEQVLADFDPGRTSAAELMDALRAVGYDVTDPRGVRSFADAGGSWPCWPPASARSPWSRARRYPGGSGWPPSSTSASSPSASSSCAAWARAVPRRWPRSAPACSARA